MGTTTSTLSTAIAPWCRVTPTRPSQQPSSRRQRGGRPRRRPRRAAADARAGRGCFLGRPRGCEVAFPLLPRRARRGIRGGGAGRGGDVPRGGRVPVLTRPDDPGARDSADCLLGGKVPPVGG